MRTRHQDDVRAKIQASQLIRRLQEHVAGKIELTSAQVQSAKILLDKSVSNAPTILAGDADAPLTLVVSSVDAEL